MLRPYRRAIDSSNHDHETQETITKRREGGQQHQALKDLACQTIIANMKVVAGEGRI